MNIVFLEAVQNFGGARKSTLELATRLKAYGHNVKLIDFWGTCEPFIKETKVIGLDFIILKKRKSPLILKNNNIIKTFKNILSYLFDMLLFRSKLSGIFQEFEADLIIVNNSKVLFPLVKSKSYKIGFFARGWFVKENHTFFHKTLIKQKVDIFMGVSQATCQAIYARKFASQDKIYSIPNAFDFSIVNNYHKRYWYEKEDSQFQLMHCGGFLPTKGQDIVLDIAVQLRARNIDFNLKLIGQVYVGEKSSNYYDYINKRILDENLQSNVEVLVDPDDIIGYYADCDLLLHPTDTEGLPRVVMEAMAFGVPVIGNPSGGMTDLILNGYTGFLPSYNHVEDYVSYISRVIDNRELYRFMSNNAQNLIRNCYTSDIQVEAFINMVKKIRYGV